MDSFKKLFSVKYSKKSTFAKQVQASLVVEFANEKIREFWGKKGQEQAKALHLKGSVLTINCTNPIMAQELKFKQNRLIQMINDKFGEGTVKRMKIVQKGSD